MKKNRICAALIFACVAIVVTVVFSPLAKADSTGYCVIPAWKLSESSCDAELYEEETETEVFVQIKTADLYTDVRRIAGFVPTNRTTAAQEPAPCPISEAEKIIMAKVLKRECGGLQGFFGGVSAKARQAAVVWCALNRLDSDDPYYPDTLAGVLTQSGAFAWIPDTYVDPELLDLAEDVVSRWWREKNGETDVGRTLPANYLFFAGRNGENYFRDKYSGNFKYWDWSLADPYGEE